MLNLAQPKDAHIEDHHAGVCRKIRCANEGYGLDSGVDGSQIFRGCASNSNQVYQLGIVVLYSAHRVDIDLPVGSIDHPQQRVQVWTPYDHLPAIFILYPFHQGGSGTYYIRIG